MDTERRLLDSARVLLIALTALTPLALGACAAEGDPAGASATNEEINAISANQLISEDDLEGHQDVTASEVERFLRSQGSRLADYSEHGRSAAELIVADSTAEHISPIYMLARIQTESSLVGSGTLAHLSAATGCGCPDGSRCDPSLANFGLQVRCAAQLVRRYLTDLHTRGETVSGYRVGHALRTSDPCTVVPANAATAALYTYTPWVGAYAGGCGNRSVGGSSLVALFVRRYTPSFPASHAGGAPSPAPAPAPGCGAYARYTVWNCLPGTRDRVRCVSDRVERETCAGECISEPSGTSDVCTPETDQGACGARAGFTHWNCLSDGHTMEKCEGGQLFSLRCRNGCTSRPSGEDDVCN